MESSSFEKEDIMSGKECCEKFIEFSEKSLMICSKNSEMEVGKIYHVISDIISDAKRRSHLSQESLKKINEYKTNPGSWTEIEKQNIKEVLSILNKDQSEFTDPIIMALQFQDRFRQNLENIIKIVKIWYSHRSSCEEKNMIDKKKMISLGEKMMDAMTSSEERQVIAKHFEGVPLEEAVGEEIMFD